MATSERSNYTTLDFLSWSETQALEISPKFQRRSVWKTPARSFLIDTLIKKMPVPPIYLRVTQNITKTRTVREVIDGQQRLRAVLEYINDKYALTKSVSQEHGGKRFSKLPGELQDNIRNYSFICEIFQSISDEEVLEVFSRLNTYAVKLNNQELRNGKYFGYFKRTAYSLAHEHLQFWRANRIFTEGRIARMDEVELTSEVMIALLDGQQDKKGTIDDFYAQYDDEFPSMEKIITSFRTIIDNINDTFEDNEISESAFQRIPLFYTLCCVVGHRLFGIPKTNQPTPRKGNLSKQDKQGLSDAIRVLSDKIQAFRDEEPLPKKYLDFAFASIRQADNLAPRKTRFNVLYTEAFS